MGLRFDLRAWVETHDLPFLVIDEAFRVVTVNDAYEHVFACSRDEVEGMPCHRVLHRRPEPCAGVGEECPLIHARATGLSHACLHAHYDADGELRLVRVHLTPLDATDGSRYYAERVEEIAPLERPGGPVGEEVRMVGRSPLFLEVMEALTSAARSVGPVLLVGEPGTGKELAARFIHHHSPRATRPFLCLDCAAVPEVLSQGELFGHELGAFLGSVGRRVGMVELAHGGTLFLDDLGELPPPVQAKLLRVIDSGEVRRIGGEEVVPVDVRIVAASNRPLWEEVAAGGFREDLFHHIACFTVELPPLRERMEDLPLIVAELLHHMPPPAGRSTYRISKAAMELLRTYRYPGNVRELKSLLQGAVAHAPQGRIEAETLLRAVRERQDPTSVVATDRAGVARRTPSWSPAELERRYLADALARHGGHRRHTADALGISERTLYRKLKRYGLE